MENQNINFISQENIYNPDKYNKYNYIIVGVGSTGSQLALTMSKRGIKNIKVIDFDIVENKNIPNQFYKLDSLGKFKVEAIADIIKDYTGTQIKKENIKIDESYSFDNSIDLNTIIILCLDSIEARKLVYEKIKDYPLTLIDTRFGLLGWAIYNIDLKDDVLKKFYESQLYNITPTKTLCGFKGVIFSIMNLCSEADNILTRIELGKENPILLKREMENYNFIALYKDTIYKKFEKENKPIQKEQEQDRISKLKKEWGLK